MAAAHKDRSRLHAALQRSVNHIFEALSYFSETSLGNWAPGWTLSMMDGPGAGWLLAGEADAQSRAGGFEKVGHCQRKRM
jgi:hypothetical protein